jgi:hypothetical protein
MRRIADARFNLGYEQMSVLAAPTGRTRSRVAAILKEEGGTRFLDWERATKIPDESCGIMR